MPLRTYQCVLCEHTKDVLEPSEAPEFRSCDACGELGGEMRRLVSAPGQLVLKGQGFYSPGTH